MVAISESTIRADVWENIYDELTADLSTGTVTASYIDDNPTFPQVVVKPISKLVKHLTIDATSKEYTGEIEIEIYAKKNEQIDSISDEVDYDLLVTNKATFEALGLYLGDLEDSNESTVFWNEQKIHIKAIIIQFKVKL